GADRPEALRQSLRQEGPLEAARPLQVLGEPPDEIVALLRQTLHVETPGDERGEDGLRERLGDEVEGALLDRPHQLVVQIGHRSRDQDDFRAWPYRLDGACHLEPVDPGRAPPFSPATGKATVTVVPRPGWLSTLISPSLSQRIDRQIARPSPNPSCLVV